MLLKAFEQFGWTMWMKPARPWGPRPPIRVVAQIDRAFSLPKNHGARNEVFNRGARKIRWIERALGHGQVAGLSDEAGELFVGDRVTIDPKAVNSYFMDGMLFNVELFRTHAKRPTRNPDHVRVPRIAGTTYRGPQVDHRRPRILKCIANTEYRTDLDWSVSPW